MRIRRSRSSLLAIASAALVLTACGATAPPGQELADEVIDTLEENGEPLSDSVKACMKQAVADFALTEQEAQGFEDLDDVAAKADDGQEQAKQIIARFTSELAACK